MIFRKKSRIFKNQEIFRFRPQNGIDSWDPLGVGAGHREGGGQPDMLQKVAQDVGRGPPGPRETGAIIQTR